MARVVEVEEVAGMAEAEQAEQADQTEKVAGFHLEVSIAAFVWIVVLAVLVVTLLGGCSTGNVPKRTFGGGMKTVATGQNEIETHDDGTVSASSQGLVTITDVTPTGIKTATHGLHATGGIGEYGTSFSVPGDGRADTFESKMQYPVIAPDGSVVVDTDGNPVLTEQVITMTGASFSMVAQTEAQWAGMAAVMVPLGIKLYETNTEQYEQWMVTVREATPELADVIEAAVRVVFPSPIP